MTVFPINDILNQVCAAFAQQDIILSAPPGAGKSTCVPLALLKEYSDKRFLMLQPRRVVVRHLAKFLAKQLNESVGQTIGYRMRGESVTSKDTRFTLVTEGVLTRLLQKDPELTEYDGIIFDEFHERNVHADIGLALSLECQHALRDDLRIMIMSATLDQDSIQQLLPQAQVFTSQGRMFNVDVNYIGDIHADDLIRTVVSVTKKAVNTHLQGDILVFLPTVKAIKTCSRELVFSNIDVMPLYGGLDDEAQLRAVQPHPEGRRKIILATNIAETSLTIEGVKIVVDSGREQHASFDSETAVTSLVTKMISKPSATQRMGRAGRLSQGYCYRLWSKEAQDRLSQKIRPQILDVDLSPHLLEVISWGTDFSNLPLLDMPSDKQLADAKNRLAKAGLVKSNGSLQPKGSKIMNQPFHPCVSAMLLDVQTGSIEERENAALAASLLENNGRFSFSTFEELLTELRQPTRFQWYWTLKNARKFLNLDKKLNISLLKETMVAAFMAVAFPQRIAYKVSDKNWKMASGPQFSLESHSNQSRWCFLLQGQKLQAGAMRVFSILHTDLDCLFALMSQSFNTSQSLYLDKSGKMKASKDSCFLDIVYNTQPVSDTESINWSQAWINLIKKGLGEIDPWQLPLNESGQQWLIRAKLATDLKPDLFAKQEFDSKHLVLRADEWLTEALEKVRSIEQLKKLPWTTLLDGLLQWQQKQTLESLAPASIKLASGKQVALFYEMLSDDSEQIKWRVVAAMRMQECYGMNDRMFIGGGRIPVTFSLLSPALRPIQTTQDLGNFWLGSYQQVAKEMRGRYPKHFWPEEPQNSKPTSKTKKYMNEE